MNPDRRPLVLFRTPFFGANPVNDIVGHELQDRFTFDQDFLGEADVVVFHVPELRWAKIGNTPKYPGQLWVAWSMESNINYPELSDPSFMSAFDLSMTYERSADIRLTYVPSPDSWKRVSQLGVPPKIAEAPVVTFQSALFNESGRNDFTAELMRHVKVHSYGKHLRNCRLPEPDLGRQTKLQTIADYHFCLAFENSVAPDYVTEKIYDCFMAGVVPIYLGAPNVAEFAPGDSYINATAYGGPNGLASYLSYLLGRPDEYRKYLAWRDKPLPQSLAAMMEATAIHPFVRLLELAKAKKEVIKEYRIRPPRTEI